MTKAIKNKKQTPIMKKYAVLFWQEAQTSDLSTKVFESTLSDALTWVRESAGYYKATLVNEFTDEGVYFPPFGNYGGDATTWIPIKATEGTILGYYTLFQINEDELGIFIEDTSGNRVDLFDLIGSTNLSLPRIEVYS